MALTRLVGANAISGTLPAANINNTSISSVTSLPAAISTGKVLQVVSTSSTTETSTTSTSWVDTAMTANITPSSSSNKIYIIGSTNGQSSSSNERNNLSIFRDSTNLGDSNQGFGRSLNADELMEKAAISYLDSPSTTSQITYTLKLRSHSGGTVQTNSNGSRGTITLMEIAG